MTKRIVVSRSVYDAAQELQKAAEACGGGALSLAEKKMDDCITAGDKPEARFWRDVWMYLISDAYMDAPVHIVEGH